MTYTPKPDWYYAIVEDLIDKELERLENDEEYNKEREEMFQNRSTVDIHTDNLFSLVEKYKKTGDEIIKLLVQQIKEEDTSKGVENKDFLSQFISSKRIDNYKKNKGKKIEDYGYNVNKEMNRSEEERRHALEVRVIPNLGFKKVKKQIQQRINRNVAVASDKNSKAIMKWQSDLNWMKKNEKRFNY